MALRLLLSFLLIFSLRVNVVAADFTPLTSDYAQAISLGEVYGLSGTILFSANIKGYDRILVLDLDAGRVRKVIDGPGNNSFPIWSPDGTRFAFISDRDGNKEIYVASWDGSQVQRLTDNAVDDENPAWFPDGKRLMYASVSPKPGSQDAGTTIFQLDPDDPKPSVIVSLSRRNTFANVNHDASTLTYSTNRFWPGWDVCLYRIAGKKETCPLKGEQSYCRSSFDPAGRFIAFSQGVLNDIDIGILDLSSGTNRVVTALPGREYDAAWSPDGDRLIFAAENGTSEQFNLYILPLEKGKEVRPLLKAPFPLRYPSWASQKTLELEAERMRRNQGAKAPK